jgi:two-component system response regulator CpxR
MPFDRSLDMHLSNLRKKLPGRQDGRPRVKTLRGKGYIWIP